MPSRTLVVFAPGTNAGRRAYFGALDKLGIKYEVGLQVESHKRAYQTDEIDLDKLDAREMYEQYAAEWQPKKPVLVYYDYEPYNWAWSLLSRIPTVFDLKLVARVRREFRKYQRAARIKTPIAMYGLPVSPRNRPWIPSEIEHVRKMKPLLDGFGWIMFDIYARGAVVNADTEQGHRDKITQNHATLKSIFPRRPIVPMLYLHAHIDEGNYGEVYFDQLGKMGVDRVGLWANPNSEDDTGRSIEQLKDNAKYIARWQRGSK